MTRLSVNINKIATIRNARGGNLPNVLEAALNCERYGAHGITVHPRPDERHIKYQDVRDIKSKITTELNIEGYPTEKFISLVLEVLPHQVTLVPDPPDAITSNAGWDTKKHKNYLKEIIAIFQAKNIRTSIFVDTKAVNINYAAKTGTNRVELYTESYATLYPKNKINAVKSFVQAAALAKENGLEINAGHDLNLENLKYFCENTLYINEVSIGHALISDALYFGLENTIQMYLRELK
ncbi:MAG: pyridoxine 5'-phosphate synthase [Bacteroidales bacterium]|nr:pyridoxine 5'-phosphate synthase [Bacteroidales bacterium]